MTKPDRPSAPFRPRGLWLGTILAGIGLILLLVACRPTADSILLAATPTGEVTPTPASTSTPRPTATPTPAPTLTPTPAPSPTATSPPSPIQPRRTVFDGERAYQLVVEQTGFGYRPTGSEAGWATGDWIIRELTEAGWRTETEEFSYLGVLCRNILGKMPANEEQPVVLLGAHYDTRRRADQDPDHPSEPVMGANDGASGTAVLLELAHVLDFGRIPYQVWLAFFDAEDNGRLDGWDWIVGSSYMASQLAVRPDFVIIVDMVGDADQQIYYEQNSDPVLMEAIWQTAADLGYGDTIIPEYGYAMLDDHTPFVRMGIPAVDMIDFDYPYWHTTADTADKVSADSLERVGRTLETFLEAGQVTGDIHE
jgi:glutaminyl-peptide cyclotransferase